MQKKSVDFEEYDVEKQTMPTPLRSTAHKSWSARYLTRILESSGITIDGGQPWDIKVNDDRFFSRVLANGSIGFGDSYIEGWWECEALDLLSERLNKYHLSDKTNSLAYFWHSTKAKLINRQSSSRSHIVAEKHYNLDTKLFKATLDEKMIYSSAYWKKAKTLDQAQEDKLDLICRKLKLKPGMFVLDVGSGWGGFLQFAAKNYGIKGVGVTVSAPQAIYAQNTCGDLPLEFFIQDYRNIHGQFDRICSIGMFEHVGYKNYAEFMDIIHRNLKPEGLFLLQTIGSNISVTNADPWIEKHIFPNGMLPSVRQIGKSIENNFVMEDWHNFGGDYDKTLMAWHQNFQANWPDIKNDYGIEFYRMWEFYLLMCAGAFRARTLQLWQIVLSKDPATPYYRTS